MNSIGALFALVLFASGAQANQVVSFSDEVSGLSLGVTFALNPHQSNEKAREAFIEVKGELSRLAHAFSKPLVFQPDPIALNAEEYALLATLLSFSKELDNTLDPTLGVIEDLYPFGEKNAASPSAALINEYSSRVGLDKIALDAPTRSLRILNAGTQVDFRRILKGYALDQGGARLKALGFDNFLFHLDGQVLTRGSKHERKWAVGVRDPRGGEPFATFEHEGAVRTRSDSENHFIETIDEKTRRVFDVFDPRSRAPVDHIRSLTVLAPDATSAELLSQALFVLGVEKAIRYCEKNAGVSVIIVDDKNAVFVSKRIKKSVRLNAPSAGK